MKIIYLGSIFCGSHCNFYISVSVQVMEKLRLGNASWSSPKSFENYIFHHLWLGNRCHDGKKLSDLRLEVENPYYGFYL